jgi:hypothetical protein
VNTRFILSRSANLQGALMNVPNPQSSVRLIPLSEGTYYWTVQGETNEGVNLSPASPASFRVGALALLPAARSLQPGNGFRIGPEELRISRTMSFSWAAVPGANRYILAVYREAGNGRQLIRRWDPSTQTSRMLDDLGFLGAGSFIWQVEAVNQGANGAIVQHGTAAENRFTIDLPALPRTSANDPGKIYGQ